MRSWHRWTRSGPAGEENGCGDEKYSQSRTASLVAESAQSKLTRMICCRFWQLATDVLAPQDAQELGEDLGLEWDSAEHGLVEKGPLCAEKRNLKRKRC